MIYKQTRKNHSLTRDEVCDRAQALGFPLQPERLERIENRKYPINPEEVLLLSRLYGEPSLCNHYCSRECPIGEKYVPEIKGHNLSRIILEMLSSLNSMEKRQERLIEITADEIIADDEIRDFISIQNDLEKISVAVEGLQLWVEQMLADNKINLEKYNEIKNG